MKEISVTEAEATLAKLLDEAAAGRPVAITRNGKREAVLISCREYERLARVPSLGWLLANSPLEEGDLPTRQQAKAIRASEF
jgi:prevent-host-death family protein